MLATMRHRDFALVWTAGLVSLAGDYALIVALTLHAYALTGSALATGGVFAASLLPRVLLGSIAGVFVDRWDRKRTLVYTDVLRAGMLMPLLAVNSPDLLWLLYLVRAATGLVSLCSGPAERALLPSLVGPDHLVAANALNALNDNLGRLVGPAIGGLLYAWGGLTGVVLIDAAGFVTSAALTALVRASTRPERLDAGADAASAWRRAVGEWRDGLRLVGREPLLRTIFAAIGLGFVGDGTFAVSFAPLAVDVLRGGAEAAGLLMSGQAVGGLVAGLFVARVAAKLPARFLFGGGLVGLGMCDFGLANATSLAPPGAGAVAVGVGFMFLAGFPVVAAFAAGDTLMQTRVADAYRGRVFGAYGAVQGMAMLVGLWLGGVMADVVGIVPVMSVGATMWAVGGLVALVRLPRTAERIASSEHAATA